MKRFLMLMLAGVLFVGCPYYNTFYNAKKSFKKAEELRKEALARSSTATDQADRLYDEAIENAAKVLRDYPRSDLVDDALVLIGDSFYGKRDYVRAARKYDEVLTNYPDSRWVPYCAFALGRAYYAAGDSVQAESSLQEFLEKYPKTDWAPEARLTLGTVYLKQQEYEKAIDQYTSLLTEFPHDRRRHEAQLHIAEAALALEQYDRALTLFTQVGELAHDRRLAFQAHFMVGECFRHQRQFDQALRLFQQLMRRAQYQEYTARLLLAVAECQMSLDQVDAALVNYQTILSKFASAHEHDAEVSQALYEMGLLYEQRGDLNKAEQMYGEAKSRSPRTSWVGDKATAKSVDIHQLKQYQDALASALKALRRASSEDTTRAGRTGASDDSTGVSDRKQREKVIKARFQLAETYLFQFNLADSALVQYRLAELEAPDHESAAKAAYASAWLMEHAMHDTTASREAYRTLLAQYADTLYGPIASRALSLTPPDSTGPSDAEVFRHAEQLLFNEHNADSALVQYRLVVERFPEGQYAARALYAIGWITEVVHASPDSALSIYRQLIKAYPKTEQTRMAQLKLKYVEELFNRTKAARDSASTRTAPDDTVKTASADSAGKSSPPAGRLEAQTQERTLYTPQTPRHLPSESPPVHAPSPATSDSTATIRQSINRSKRGDSGH